MYISIPRIQKEWRGLPRLRVNLYASPRGDLLIKDTCIIPQSSRRAQGGGGEFEREWEFEFELELENGGRGNPRLSVVLLVPSRPLVRTAESFGAHQNMKWCAAKQQMLRTKR